MDFNQDDAFSEEDVDTIVSPAPPPTPAMAQWTPGLGCRARSSRAHLFSGSQRAPRARPSQVKNAITSTLGEASYIPKKVNDWINTIVDSCLKELQSLNRPYKYIVTCIIMQKNGAGLDTASSLWFDTQKDGKVVVPWENGTMHVICPVFGLALNIDNIAELD